jgi:hypothetical protein
MPHQNQTAANSYSSPCTSVTTVVNLFTTNDLRDTTNALADPAPLLPVSAVTSVVNLFLRLTVAPQQRS